MSSETVARLDHIGDAFHLNVAADIEQPAFHLCASFSDRYEGLLQGRFIGVADEE